MSTILIPDVQEYSVEFNPHQGRRQLRVIYRETGQVSDGEHTFDELYEHRHLLFCGLLCNNSNAYKSRLHYDGSIYGGYFIAGCDLCPGVIACHLPTSMWDLCPAHEIERAPEWDGHTSNDVYDRLRDWLSRSAQSTQQ